MLLEQLCATEKDSFDQPSPIPYKLKHHSPPIDAGIFSGEDVSNHSHRISVITLQKSQENEEEELKDTIENFPVTLAAPRSRRGCSGMLEVPTNDAEGTGIRRGLPYLCSLNQLRRTNTAESLDSGLNELSVLDIKYMQQLQGQPLRRLL